MTHFEDEHRRRDALLDRALGFVDELASRPRLQDDWIEEAVAAAHLALMSDLRRMPDELRERIETNAEALIGRGSPLTEGPP